MTDLTQTIESLLEQGDQQQALQAVLAHFDCCVGTVHFVDPKSGDLLLDTQIGVPAPVVSKIERVPIGKGMAGIAAERKEAVQVCNLQTDNSGVVRPGAKETAVEGSIATPMLQGERVVGTLGVAKPVPYEFTDAEAELLLTLARRFGDHAPKAE